MKIVHIIPSLGNGGAEKFVVDLANEQSKRNYTLLVSFKVVNSKMFFVKNISPNVRFVILNKHKGFDIKFLFRLLCFIRKEKPDIINTHLSAINYIFPIVLLFYKVKYFHTIHSIAQIEEKRKLFRSIRQIYFINELITPICLSNGIRESYNNIYNTYEPIIIFNGVKAVEKTNNYVDVQKEINRYKKNQLTRVFLIVARFSAEKNLLMITKVFKRLFYEKKNGILLMIGEDPAVDKGNWNKVLSNKAPNTFLLGSKANVGDYILCSDVLCLCSIYEGMPITILEAFSAGIPVISTPVGGVPDILGDNENGILSSDIDEESYYLAISRYNNLSDESIKKIKRKNKSVFNEKYSIEIASNNYGRLYNSKSSSDK